MTSAHRSPQQLQSVITSSARFSYSLGRLRLVVAMRSTYCNESPLKSVLDLSSFSNSMCDVLLDNQRGIKKEGKCHRGNFDCVKHLSVSQIRVDHSHQCVRRHCGQGASLEIFRARHILVIFGQAVGINAYLDVRGLRRSISGGSFANSGLA